MEDNNTEEKFSHLLQEKRHKELIGVLKESNAIKEKLIELIDGYKLEIESKVLDVISSDKGEDKSESLVDLSNNFNSGIDKISKSIEKLVALESKDEIEKEEEWEFTVLRDDYGEKIKKVIAKKIV